MNSLPIEDVLNFSPVQKLLCDAFRHGELVVENMDPCQKKSCQRGISSNVRDNFSQIPCHTYVRNNLRYIAKPSSVANLSKVNI